MRTIAERKLLSLGLEQCRRRVMNVLTLRVCLPLNLVKSLGHMTVSLVGTSVACLRALENWITTNFIVQSHLFDKICRQYKDLVLRLNFSSQTSSWTYCKHEMLMTKWYRFFATKSVHNYAGHWPIWWTLKWTNAVPRPSSMQPVKFGL